MLSSLLLLFYEDLLCIRPRGPVQRIDQQLEVSGQEVADSGKVEYCLHQLDIIVTGIDNLDNERTTLDIISVATDGVEVALQIRADEILVDDLGLLEYLVSVTPSMFFSLSSG